MRQGNDAAPPGSIKAIDRPRDLDQLLSFFPDFDKDKRSSVAGLWEPTTDIEVVGRDGSAYQVMTNGDSWTAGKGDWPVREGFARHLEELFAN